MEKNPDTDVIDLDPEVFLKFFHEIARMKSMLVLQLLKIPSIELILPHLKSLSPPDNHEDLQFVAKKISMVK